MLAMTYDHYGPADTVHRAEIDQPQPKPGEVLVRISHSSVTTADWRIRASAFPGGFWFPGRLMFGLFRPRNKVLGGEFAGQVVGLGPGVEGFQIGDPVFGFAGTGTHAEYLTIKAEGCIAQIPPGLTPEGAAALPFGGLAALVFLRDFAKLQPGERVLIPGASGGVGVYLVQLAKAMGAEVTAVASRDNLDLLRTLGADRVIDYRQQNLSAAGRDYDLVIDPAGFVTYRQARALLHPGGRFVMLNFALTDVVRALLTRLTGGPRMIIGVSGDSSRTCSTWRSWCARASCARSLATTMRCATS